MFAAHTQIRPESQFARRARTLPATLAVAVLAGCAGGPQADLATVAPAQAGDAYLSVTNRHPHHIVIVAKNQRHSETLVGTVRVQASRRLTLPRTMNGAPVEIVIRCQETGETHTTREVVWEPKDRLDLSIPDLLPLSHLALRPLNR